MGLAGAGDGRAWDLVFKRLQLLLRRPSRVMVASEVVAVAYLVQHNRGDRERLGVLVEALRSSWDRMNGEEARWFTEFWPEVLPGGPLTTDVPWPDGKRVRHWVRDLLFYPVPIPVMSAGAAEAATDKEVPCVVGTTPTSDDRYRRPGGIPTARRPGGTATR